MDKNKITGIVLAGGKSRRMGAEKGMLKFGGKRLIEHAIFVLEKVCDRIIIIENSDTYDFLGYPVFADIIPNAGPMGGIYTGLMNSETDLNLVLSCDMPFISEKTLRYLMDNTQGFDVAVPWHSAQKFEPMCAAYHKNTIAVFEEFIQNNNYKVFDIYSHLNVNKIQMSAELNFYKPYLFDNLNSKADLKKANQYVDEVLPQMHQLILIAGTGRNVGKTTLVCEFIKQTSIHKEVIGLKISPHVHTQNENAKLIFETNQYSIFQENNKQLDKDSSRMLRAGAKQVFYIQSDDEFIGEAFQKLRTEIKNDLPIVCESGGLRNFVIPSAFLICNKKGNTVFKEKHHAIIPKADKMLQFDESGFDYDVSEIKFENGKWRLKKS